LEAGSQFLVVFHPELGGFVVASHVFKPTGPGAPFWKKEFEKPVPVIAGETVATWTSSKSEEYPPE